MKRFSRSWASLPALVTALAWPVTARAQDVDVPAGFGSLRQDQVAVRITTDNLVVRALPLDERVIRLLAPDAYRALHELAQSRADDIAQAARASGRDSIVAVLVTFFSLQPQVRFNPDQLYISSQNVFFRSIGIVPLTPRWSEYQLDQRQQARAIYLFEPGVQILRPFTVFYGDRSSDAWAGTLRALDGERARVRSRAGAQPQP